MSNCPKGKKCNWKGIPFPKWDWDGERVAVPISDVLLEIVSPFDSWLDVIYWLALGQMAPEELERKAPIPNPISQKIKELIEAVQDLPYLAYRAFMERYEQFKRRLEETIARIPVGQAIVDILDFYVQKISQLFTGMFQELVNIYTGKRYDQLLTTLEEAIQKLEILEEFFRGLTITIKESILPGFVKNFLIGILDRQIVALRIFMKTYRELVRIAICLKTRQCSPIYLTRILFRILKAMFGTIPIAFTPYADICAIPCIDETTIKQLLPLVPDIIAADVAAIYQQIHNAVCKCSVPLDDYPNDPRLPVLPYIDCSKCRECDDIPVTDALYRTYQRDYSAHIDVDPELAPPDIPSRLHTWFSSSCRPLDQKPDSPPDSSVCEASNNPYFPVEAFFTTNLEGRFFVCCVINVTGAWAWVRCLDWNQEWEEQYPRGEDEFYTRLRIISRRGSISNVSRGNPNPFTATYHVMGLTRVTAYWYEVSASAGQFCNTVVEGLYNGRWEYLAGITGSDVLAQERWQVPVIVKTEPLRKIPCKIMARLCRDCHDMSNDCCEELLAEIDEIKQTLNAIKRAIGDFPILAPITYIGDGDGTDPDAIELESIAEAWSWWIREFDAVLGEFPIKIKITDVDPNEEGNQTQTVRFPNLSETLAEIFSIAFTSSYNSAINTDLAIRIIQMLVAEMAQDVSTGDYVKAIADYLGFRINEVQREVPIPVTISKGEKGEDIVEDLDDFRKESKMKTLGVEYKGAETLVGILQKLVFAAGIIKAVHTMSAKEPKEVDGKAIIERFNGKRIDEDLADYLRQINRETSVRNKNPNTGQPKPNMPEVKRVGDGTIDPYE